ncbi:flagellar export protein FliJ [Tissierella sp.]|uniref:flagellar export protein FliJ n=1 Tax=Tissierella sp. TaxID=41274 RepID=UPI0028571F5B|nr:flagellar export protein FliJ [Tissierella sp.]MDR7856270.1 flagellar export protein FliJ [Tissierella sp.]
MQLAGYSFKLERILNYKENIENFKKVEYGNVNQKLISAEEILESFYFHKNKLITEKNETINNISIANLKLYNDYLQDISSNIENQEHIIIEIKKELEKAKEELLVAMQERKSFEKLKENDYNEFLSESKKKEDKVIDGIVTFNISTQ